MANNIIKNSRFKTGSHVDILYNPVYESNTVAITDSTAAGLFQLTLTLNDAMTAEISSGWVAVGDVCALNFGVGIISAITNDYVLVVDYPDSMFPDTNVMRYVGTEFQHVYIFNNNQTDELRPYGARMNELLVQKYTQTVNTAEYGYGKINYNRQTDAVLSLVPLKMVDDGHLDAVHSSTGHVLKSCDDDDYAVESNSWDANFPIELSGTSIDPIYRLSFLQKRVIEAKGRRARSTMQFTLVG